MNSFYGGKQGNSFIIAQTYTSIAEMVESFGKNNSSCPVNFDEYVLINTINKNNPENGQIFRRGYDYNSNRTITSFHPSKDNSNPYATAEIKANGAVYIGTIVGPAGRAPIFHFDHYDKVDNLSKYKTLNPNALFTYSLRRINETSISNFLFNIYNKTKIDKDVILSELNILTKDENFHDLLAMMVKEDMSLQEFYYLQLGQPEPLKAMPLALDFNDTYANIDISIIDTTAFDVYYYYDTHFENNQKLPSDWYIGDLIPIKNSDTFHAGGDLIPGVTYTYDKDGKLLYDIAADGKRSMRKGVNELGNTYQDTIDWTYCTVRNENLEDSTAYIGFRFASPVIEFETESVDAYYNRSDIIGENGLPNEASPLTHEFTNLNLIERAQTKDDIESHPFYSLWKINIPKGIKGESIHNFRCITANSDVYKFKLDNEGNLSYNNIGEIQVEDYEGKQDDIDNSRKIFVFDYVCYDRKAEGEWHTIYAGDYNVFKHVTVAEDGTITMDFTHNDTITYPKLIHWINTMNFADDGTVTIDFNNDDLNIGQIIKGKINLPQLIKWITEVKLNEETGKFEIDFNYPQKTNIDGTVIEGTETHYETDLTWLKYFDVDEQGNVTYTFTHDTDKSISRVDANFIKWIKEVKLDAGNGDFEVTFNYDTTEKPTRVYESLQWVKDITIAADGTITTDYTNKDDKVQTKFIKWLNSISLNPENGKFIITYNHDTDVNGNPTILDTDLTWVKDIHVNTDGSVTYTRTTDTVKQTENPLTWITGFTFEDNGDIRVTFNNSTISTIEKNIQWINDIIINDDGAGNGNQKLSIKYNNKNNYIDIGSPLNYVMRMVVNSANGDLLALYSDPEKRKSGYSYDGVSGWTVLGNVKYSKSMTKEAYNNATAAERVSDLIAGAVCYRTEVIE